MRRRADAPRRLRVPRRARVAGPLPALAPGVARPGRFRLRPRSRRSRARCRCGKTSAASLACRIQPEHVPNAPGGKRNAAKTGQAWTPDDPGAYFRTVARNVAMNHFTVKARKPAIARDVEVDEAAGLGLDPEEAARHAELLATFERERGTLTEEEAEVFEGRMLNGMTFPAIAAVLQRPISTVHAQFRRAVEKLNAIVERVW